MPTHIYTFGIIRTMVTVQTIEEAIQWIHGEHKKCPIQYVFLSSQIPHAYELFDNISIAPVQMVDNCKSSQTSREIQDIYNFYHGRILVVDSVTNKVAKINKEQQTPHINWLYV